MIKLTSEQFLDKFYKAKGTEYKVISNYVNFRTKIKIKHEKCGKEYYTTADIALKYGCPYCHTNHHKTTEEFKDELKEKYQEEYEVIGEYKSSRKLIEVRHKICGNSYFVTPDNVLRGKKCPYCSKHTPFNDSTFKKYINTLYPEEYTIISSYTGMHNKIEVKHNKCGFTWYVEPNSLMRESGCPHCHASKGEKRIEKYLINNNINYIKQYYFNDCRGKRKPLLFDFAIFDKNNKLIYCIEYDGEQHYKDVDVFGGKEAFVDTLYRDTTKSNYCKHHKIKLIRIPYWDYDNIEKILSNL